MTTKVEPYTESEENRNKNLKQLFWILKCYLRICGYYYELDIKEGKSRCFQILMKIYCGFCALCSLFNATRTVVEYGYVTNNGGSEITYMAYIVFYTAVVCFSITMIMSLSTNFKLLVQLFASNLNKNVNFSHKLNKMTHILFFVVSLVAFQLHVGGVIVQETTMPTLPRFPFDQLKGNYKHVGTSIYAVATMVGSLGPYIIWMVYNVISYCIYKEFAAYSTKFKRLYDGPKDVFEEKFQELWDEHVFICDVLRQAETFLKHFVSITYLATMPIFCFLVYGLIKGGLSIEEFGFVAVIFCMCVLQIADTTLVGVVINDKAHEPLQHVFHSQWKSFSDDTMQKVSLLVSRLSSERIGFSVYGLFIIDRSTILMVCGTILTYAVVVLQLQTGSGCDDNHWNINVTQTG